MYNFVDVNRTSEAVILPSEALRLNGEYIENLIPGYRTLYVEGREALSPELDYFSVGSSDGATQKSKRYPERIITVTYQLIAKTSEDFRQAYNQLGKILNVEDAELIFNDEPDKFFKGTPSHIGEVPPGKNAVIGTIEFLCVDPFKYSVLEYEATPSLDDSSILVDYEGTYKAFPTLVAEFFDEQEVSEDGEEVQVIYGGGDCGYVAFFNENEKIIQLGDPDEVDGEENAYPKAQTLINQKFNKTTSWGTAAKKLWATNKGVVRPTYITQVGSVGMGVSENETITIPIDTSATILKGAKSEQNEPTFEYSIVCKATNRAANSVKINVSITAKLTRDTSYFGRGYGLKASLYMGGSWRTAVLKTTDEYWKGRSAHTKNLSFTISGLSTTQTSLTGIKFKVERTDTNGQNAGALKERSCSNMPISEAKTTTPATYYLAPTSYGTGTSWHAATITRDIPADKAGEIGAANFGFCISNKMHIGSSKNDLKQKGGFQVMLSDADGRVIAGFRIRKNSNGKTAKVFHIVNNETAGSFNVDLSYNNRNFGDSVKTSEYSFIKKVRGAITFSVAGIQVTHQDDDIAASVVTTVTIGFEQYGNHPVLMRNGINWVKFIKYNCETWKDIPNKFSAGDIVEADCKTGDIYFNGVRSPEYGALGNDWEDFFLTPGLNQIGFSFSDWVEEGSEPNCKIRYREVFL